mgnify:CR=1 FL=1
MASGVCQPTELHKMGLGGLTPLGSPRIISHRVEYNNVIAQNVIGYAPDVASDPVEL